MKRAMETVAAVTLGLVLAGCGSGADSSMSGMSMGSGSAAESSGASTGQNDADVMFAQMMVPHHAQAIEMSDVLIAKDGVDEQVLQLAQRIKDAQGPEIEQMTSWLQAWGAEVPDTSTGSMGSMQGMDHGGTGGMMSAEDMQALEDADGATASRLFLEQMVEHHQGAIEMAQAELENGQDPAALQLADSIVSTQQAEITEMQDMLEGM